MMKWLKTICRDMLSKFAQKIMENKVKQVGGVAFEGEILIVSKNKIKKMTAKELAQELVDIENDNYKGIYTQVLGGNMSQSFLAQYKQLLKNESYLREYRESQVR